MGLMEGLVKLITPPTLTAAARGWFYCAAVAALAATGVSKQILVLFALMAYCQAIRISIIDNDIISEALVKWCNLAYAIIGASSLSLLLYQSSLEYIIYADIIALSALWIICLATGRRYSPNQQL